MLILKAFKMLKKGFFIELLTIVIYSDIVQIYDLQFFSKLA